MGTDPLIGQGPAGTETYTWPATWSSNQAKSADFSHWITMKGREYFFAPSMSYLKSLAISYTKNNEVINEYEYIIHELKEYQDLHWAIGTNPGSDGKDRFVEFFKDQKLPDFKSYARTSSVLVGEPSAYDDNIDVLKDKIHQIDPHYNLYLD